MGDIDLSPRRCDAAFANTELKELPMMPFRRRRRRLIRDVAGSSRDTLVCEQHHLLSGSNHDVNELFVIRSLRWRKRQKNSFVIMRATSSKGLWCHEVNGDWAWKLFCSSKRILTVQSLHLFILLRPSSNSARCHLIHEASILYSILISLSWPDVQTNTGLIVLAIALPGLWRVAVSYRQWVNGIFFCRGQKETMSSLSL